VDSNPARAYITPLRYKTEQLTPRINRCTGCIPDNSSVAVLRSHDIFSVLLLLLRFDRPLLHLQLVNRHPQLSNLLHVTFCSRGVLLLEHRQRINADLCENAKKVGFSVVLVSASMLVIGRSAYSQASTAAAAAAGALRCRHPGTIPSNTEVNNIP